MVIRVVSFGLLLSFLAGCGDYAIDLPNGYRLVRTNSDNILIFEPDTEDYRNSTAYSRRTIHDGDRTYHDSVVVPSKIVAIGSKDELVYGIVEISPHPEGMEPTEPGYFVLDTHTGDGVLGMGEKAFQEKLKELGIVGTPSLTTNIRWFCP
jgi:hypothetical protein